MGRTRVLPVYPRFPLTFWGYKTAVKYTGRKATMPPTGLLTVMAMLPEDKFEALRLVDENVEPLTDEHIRNSDIIFTSAMIVQEDSLNRVVKRAHALGKKAVAGGPFVTTYYDRTNADYTVAGEAEVTLRPFLEDLSAGTTQRIWTEESVAGRSSAQLTKTGKVNLTHTPLPRWDLLDFRDYFSAAIQYSRGCSFDCDFCDITKLFGREPRTKTPEQMILELEAVYNAGHRGSVFFVDDNFIGNLKNVRALLPPLAGWQRDMGYPFSLFTEASMNLSWDNNTDILKGMNDAGFDSVFVGIESIDTEVLKTMHKGQNTKISQFEAVRRMQKAGLEVLAGFIVGSDGEKEDVFYNLFNFIQEAGIPVPMPGLLTALRGTDLYTRLEREGRIREESKGNHTHHLRFNFKPQQDENFLIEGYKSLIGKLFSPANYYQRCRTLQANLGPNHAMNRTSLEGILAFGKSLRKQLFAKGGWEYLKYLIETAITNPSYFPEAVAHAIKFDHFSTLTEATLVAGDYIPHTEGLYKQFVSKAREIYGRGSKRVHERSERISRKAHKIIAIAEKKYNKLHEDFRGGAYEALERLRTRLAEEVDMYKSRSVEQTVR